MSVRDLKFLARLLGKDEPWAYTLVTATILADAFLARGMVREAALALGKAIEPRRKLQQLARKHRPGYVPREFEDYEQRVRRTLDGFEPPVAHGRDPLRTLRALCRELRPRRLRPRAGTAIDALDAVITAGAAVDQDDLENRVVEQIARMLGSRVLFHHVRGTYRVQEPQRVHTLSSWTVLRLARATRVRRHRIRRCPEFWRPEQRRPRGVIAFPIGDGVAAIARGRSFDARDAAAVGTILRFVAERAASIGDRSAAEARSPKQDRTPARPHAHGLIGSSPAWRRVLDDVWRFGPARCNVVIRGETGTGKELVARALHLNSERAGGPFVAVNCAAIHGDTMLAELFGHIRGAFSGADRSRDGLIREAHRGTLFLDEVGDMPHAMQVALLRTLQERRVRPVGSARTRPVDVRVVVATHHDLEARVREGHFREDLFHRLHVVELTLPPLRERRADLPDLCTHLLERCGHGDLTITPEAADALARHPWPGNVRELENVLQACALLCEGGVIDGNVVEQVLAMRRREGAGHTDAVRLRPRSSRMLGYLRKRWWSAPDLARTLGVSTRTVNRDLRELSDRGLVVRDGAARSRRYRAATPTP